MGGNTFSKPIPRQNGRVKWFNNKTGFGFITISKDATRQQPLDLEDVFVHYSSIDTGSGASAKRKYLVQGEYVEFELAKPEKGDHEIHAVNVTRNVVPLS